MKILRKIAFPICVLFVLAAFSLRYYFNQWDKNSFALLIAGGVFFLLSLILDWREIIATFRKRAVKYGLSSLISIILALAILSILNYMNYKHYKRFDLTVSKRFSLSEQTIQLLENLPRPVHIMTFFPEDQPLANRKFNDLMREFQTHTNKITTDMYDIDLQPQLAQKWDVKIPGTIVFESGQRHEKINKVAEEDLINAIVKVTKDIKKVVYFLEGHQEFSIDDTSSQGLSVFKEKLQKENYEIKKVILASTPEIPLDASALIIASPVIDLLPHEIEGIINYVNKGGHLLLFIDSGSSNTLEKLSEQWGVLTENSIVIDTAQGYFGGNAFIPQVRTIFGSPISTSFSLNGFFPYTRSLKKMENSNPVTVIRTMVESTENSWAEFNQDVAEFTENVDHKGPVPVGISIIQKINNTDKDFRVIIFGDIDFIKNGWFNILGNGNIALNSVAWLTEEMQLISLKTKPEETAQLPFEAFELKKFMKFSQLIAPGIIVLIGIIVWIRRRKA
ncbi:MAG: hypothetical protein A2Y62_13665 [Candidatus Fischerbacteria bacterium RBG_13_37_8]|uniref:Uncharacterized protein n=1 Tax=Candidatus Fischerbacteria bacterium RBG_13_37_8 TaxID=1817863 RepID=A0A1F5V8T9_9BACT|nr:MAG: hypothetical protein A2Y62_13665 [Candidatus Fischerbacteria bacterium RBG_13_37_8]